MVFYFVSFDFSSEGVGVKGSPRTFFGIKFGFGNVTDFVDETSAVLGIEFKIQIIPSGYFSLRTSVVIIPCFSNWNYINDVSFVVLKNIFHRVTVRKTTLTMSATIMNETSTIVRRDSNYSQQSRIVKKL